LAKPLVVHISNHCLKEQEYVISWILNEVFGVDFKIFSSKDHLHTTIKYQDSKDQINISNLFFRSAHGSWLQNESIPNFSSSMVSFNIENEKISLVSLFPIDEQLKSKKQNDETIKSINIPFDLLGTIFFLISRYEEIVEEKFDLHDRFQSTDSLMFKSGVLQKAIGNEYIEVLWKGISKLWPTLKRKKRSFKMLPSHDIDFPSFYWNKSEKQILQKCAGDIFRRNSIKSAFARYSNWIKFKKNKDYFDPYDTCDYLMSQSEKHNIKSAFYYIPIKTHKNDPGMPIDHPVVEDQWSRIISRGHEIGCHAGYMSYNSQEILTKSVDAIITQLDKLKNRVSTLGGRQHVLRWNTSFTPMLLDEAGLNYDSTLGYAETTGFRCGICYEYPMYDLIKRKQLNIRQRPLLVMDVSLLSSRYLGLDKVAAYDKVVKIKRECQKYEGDFTILWHNTELQTDEKRELYQAILQA